MNQLEKAKKIIIRFLSKNDKSFFYKGYSEQKRVLVNLREPKNLIERSIYQYKCQMKGYSIILRLSYNIFSIFIGIYYLCKFYNESFHIEAKSGEKLAVFLREGVTTKIIPNSLQHSFDRIIESPMLLPIYLDRCDKYFLFKNCIKRYWYKPYFCAKCIIKLGTYSNVINRFQPIGIITHNEYSFTSSFLTEYCHFKKIQHINVMHGEKLFNIRDAFVQFDKFYVWDQHYVELLLELRAENEQFKVELPDNIKLYIDTQHKFKYKFTYYLAAEDEIDLLNIKLNLIKTKVPLDEICIRLHPRYSDDKQVNRIFKGFKIEKPNEVPLNVSISQCKYVISLYSTVLYQAYRSGKNVIIDDVTDSEKYEMLKELKYIMISKPHLLLSKIIKEN